MNPAISTSVPLFGISLEDGGLQVAQLPKVPHKYL